MIGVKGAATGSVPEVHLPRFSGFAEVEQSAPAVHLADGFHFYYTDHLGSTRMLDDWESGQADMQVDYYFPFGEISTLSGGGEDSRYRFTGQEDDSEIGLHYFKARYYHPGIGRFLTPDPARQQFSSYAYTGNRPLDFVDPDGRFFGFIKEGLEFVAGGFVDLFIDPIGDYLSGGGSVSFGLRPAYGSPMVTDMAPPFWGKKTYVGVYQAPPVVVTAKAPGGIIGLFRRVGLFLTSHLQRRIWIQYEILRRHGFAGLRAWQILNAPDYQLAGKIAAIASLGVPAAIAAIGTAPIWAPPVVASGQAVATTVSAAGLGASQQVGSYVNAYGGFALDKLSALLGRGGEAVRNAAIETSNIYLANKPVIDNALRSTAAHLSHAPQGAVSPTNQTLDFIYTLSDVIKSTKH